MPFRLIEITVGGEKVQARPTSFDTGSEDHDGTGLKKNKEYMVPTRYMTTCPKCVQLLEFEPLNIYVVEGGKALCVDCQCGAKASGKRVDDLAARLYFIRAIDLHVHSAMAVAAKPVPTLGSVPTTPAPLVYTSLSQTVQLFADPVEAGQFALAGLTGLTRLDV